jgi:hypothetical protein
MLAMQAPRWSQTHRAELNSLRKTRNSQDQFATCRKICKSLQITGSIGMYIDTRAASRRALLMCVCSIDKLGVVGALLCASAVLSVAFMAQLALRSAVRSESQKEEAKHK